MMKNCVITTRKGYENIPLIVGGNVKKVELSDMFIQGFTNPKILCNSETVNK